MSMDVAEQVAPSRESFAWYITDAVSHQQSRNKEHDLVWVSTRITPQTNMAQGDRTYKLDHSFNSILGFSNKPTHVTFTEVVSQSRDEPDQRDYDIIKDAHTRIVNQIFGSIPDSKGNLQHDSSPAFGCVSFWLANPGKRRIYA